MLQERCICYQAADSIYMMNLIQDEVSRAMLDRLQ